jgi:hypothetical protein
MAYAKTDSKKVDRIRMFERSPFSPAAERNELTGLEIELVLAGLEHKSRANEN